MILFRRLVFIVTVSLAFFGCKDWWPYGREGATKISKGSIYKNLQDRGDYGLFLQALDITGYKKAVNESDLLTVFAPNNAAFRDYMTNVLEVSNMSEVLLDEEKLELLTRVVSYHIIQYSWSLDDFMGFTMSSDPEAARGKGEVYKYKTLAREPMGYYEDPLNHREVQLYKREKYLPVFTTNLFKNKGVADIEGEYRRMYPNVNWIGSDNHLYVGDAAVTEQGIPADNGYLYTIDKVALPQPTIYSMLDATTNGELASTHKIFARIIQRLNKYTWDKSLSDQYALPGDSLFYHYTYANPSSTGRMPELASEWTYHDELGSNIERSMRWAVTAMIPSDEALEAWIRTNLPDWAPIAKDMNQVIDELPYNTLYHIAIAHFFDKRDLTIPTMLFNNGVTGAYSENFKPTEDQVDYIKMAANGIVYGVNTVNTSYVFDRFTRPLFAINSGDKTFRMFAEGFNRGDLYMTVSAASEDTPYTLFVVSDSKLLTQLGPTRYRIQPNTSDPMQMDIQRASSSSGSWGSYTYGNYGTLGVTDVSDVMKMHLSYGHIPAPQPLSDEQVANDEHYLRFYKMQRQASNGASQYIYTLDGEFYDEVDNPLGYKDSPNSYGEEDGIKYGTVYELQEVIRGRGANDNVSLSIQLVGGSNSSQSWKPAYKFKELCKKCGLLNSSDQIADGWNAQKDFMMFAPSNEAIAAAEAQGQGAVIPYYDPGDDGTVDVEVQAQRKALLKRWCQFYVIDRFQNNMDNYALQGMDPYLGQTDDAYEYVCRTAYDYKTLQEALYCKVGWNPADPLHMYLQSKEGEVAKTVTYWPLDPSSSDQTIKLLLPAIRGTSGIVFVIDKCFPASSLIPGNDF